MEIFIMITSFAIFLWIGSYTTVYGLDLSKRSSWLFGAIGFLCGFAIGFAIKLALKEPGGISNYLNTGLAMGGIFAITIMLNGAVMRYHQRGDKIRDDKIKTLYLQLKKRKELNFFERLAQKILEKFI